MTADDEGVNERSSARSRNKRVSRRRARSKPQTAKKASTGKRTPAKKTPAKKTAAKKTAAKKTAAKKTAAKKTAKRAPSEAEIRQQIKDKFNDANKKIKRSIIIGDAPKDQIDLSEEYLLSTRLLSEYVTLVH